MKNLSQTQQTEIDEFFQDLCDELEAEEEETEE